MSVEATYFTCTLGQAVSLELQQPHKTINSLIDHLATEVPDQPAVAFSIPCQDQAWSNRIYTFEEVTRGTKQLAARLHNQHKRDLIDRSTVALLCSSTPEFLFVWLALIRLGHAVLLIAPQCPPAAISSLCEQCEVKLLLYDEAYIDLAHNACKKATEASQELTASQLPFDHTFSTEKIVNAATEVASFPSANVEPADLAYLHHTSGTSTGIPKPIPQSHHAAVGVLPRIENGSSAATFTTTPLYHGGVADLFRAWSSRALIWLFPGKNAPITAGNIIRCLDVAAEASRQSSSVAKVKYFSSVPYVLQLLSGDSRGLQYLQQMDLVGVGGAALPSEVGDKLVSQGVNLLSRFGSAECGFLLSSHREYSKDKSWQYLRPVSHQRYIRFEPREAGLSELVVLPGWPHMAKHNREDGSFSTSDLFEPHPHIENAWKYHSRADSQLTLITGKKFDPAPVEADLSTLPQVHDAIIFGSGQPYPGVLLFRSVEAQHLSDVDLVEEIWPKVAQLNQGSQDHAKLARAMLLPMPVLETPLEKSSKGTLLRGAAEARFAKKIEGAYSDGLQSDEVVADEDLPEAIEKIVRNVSHRDLTLNSDTDLFSAGIDSVAGMQIRARLRTLLPKEHNNIPMTIVEDCGNINHLSHWIRLRRSGEVTDNERGSEHEKMQLLVAEYSNFRPEIELQPSIDQGKQVIVLTGATGALGSHILDQYRKSPAVAKIYCLVRGATPAAARERVAKALEQRKLASLSRDSDCEVIVLPAKLGDADLGLDSQMYTNIAREATAILHVAWSVNFRVRLSSFVKDNIASVTNLLNLALSSPRSAKPVFSFCSSVASAMACEQRTVPEILLTNPGAATDLGYSQSKWIAEQICARAEADTAMHGRVAIFRVGQLAGDTVHGVWNASEAWPIMLSSATSTHCLPALNNEIVDWLPVDTAATALIQGTACVSDSADSGLHIFHVLNDHSRPSWADLITWVQAYEDVRIVSPPAWVKQIEALEKSQPSHSALKLLSHWQRAYGGDDATNGDGSPRKQFATNATKAKVPVLQKVEPIDERYFGKLWQWIRQGM